MTAVFCIAAMSHATECKENCIKCLKNKTSYREIRKEGLNMASPVVSKGRP